jgi:hypothetical protein
MRKTAATTANEVLRKLARKETPDLDEMLRERLKTEAMGKKLVPWTLGGLGVGSLGGAGVGALLGGHSNRLEGALLGSMAGMLPGVVGGAAIGHAVHGPEVKKKVERILRQARQSESGVSIPLHTGMPY